MAGSNRYEGGKGSIQQVVPLGTGAVSTQTKIIGAVPKDLRVTDIRFYVQDASTGTSITAEVFARTAAGAAGNSLNTALSIDVADAATGKAGLDPVLTTTAADLFLSEGQLLEVVVTATSITAGPGDLLVEIEYVPR